MNLDRSREEGRQAQLQNSRFGESYEIGEGVPRFSVAAARKYEQIMNCKGNDQLGANSAVELAVALVGVSIFGNTAGDGIAQRHNLSNTDSNVCLVANAPTPGSYNSSELTTEPTEFMEESSGLQGSPPPEEVDRSPPTTTAINITSHDSWDLNVPSSNVGTSHFPRQEVEEAEEEVEVEEAEPEAQTSQLGNKSGSDDWLELRLGPSNLVARSELREYAGDECEDEPQQKSAPKHLCHPQTVPMAEYSSMTMATTITPQLMDVVSTSGDFTLTGPSHSLVIESERPTRELEFRGLFGRSTSTLPKEDPDVTHTLTSRYEHGTESREMHMPILQSRYDHRAGPSEVAALQHSLASAGGAAAAYGSYAGNLFAIDGGSGSGGNLVERKPWPGLTDIGSGSGRLTVSYQTGSEDFQALARRLHDNNNSSSSFLAGPSFGTRDAPSPLAGEDWRDVFKRARIDHPGSQFWFGGAPGSSRPSAGVGGSGSSGSWSRQLLGATTGQHISTPHRMPFDFLPPFGSRVQLSNPWQPSGSLLPAFPTAQQVTGDTSSSSREVRKTSPNDIWCSLTPVVKSDVSEQLPELPRQYVHLNDANVAVSHVKKYLVGKLGLSCESEVEISCRGRVLPSNFSLEQVRDVVWKHAAAATHGHFASTAIGRNLVMELNYSRRPPSLQLGAGSIF